MQQKITDSLRFQTTWTKNVIIVNIRTLNKVDKSLIMTTLSRVLKFSLNTQTTIKAGSVQICFILIHHHSKHLQMFCAYRIIRVIDDKRNVLISNPHIKSKLFWLIQTVCQFVMKYLNDRAWLLVWKLWY